MVYGDLDGLRAYAMARGNSSLGEDADVSAALQRGSDYIRFFYAANSVRTPADSDLEAAAYEAAQIEAAKPGFFNQTYTPGEAKVLTEVKGIKWTVVGNGAGDGAMTPTSTIIEAILGPYTPRSAGLGIRSLGA
ncbi:hypothetical protein [Leisingera methylohalidivorans]|uniref:Uncharacterized protein n=1 Tax=Leisingera methylohalidivorans DSM 14336 TaxID=999552 RepID=V9VYC0_9RHOB|nr:hypothetical protein [Leisingera methylohalidivorans]AHD02943.1 hypothetical protein METH_06845 [Leisingera methylohalidivorans DSM 14336]